MSIISQLRQGIITTEINGNIIISNYVDDKKEGRETTHYPDGYSICHYQNGIKHGVYEIENSENGEIILSLIGQYYNGLKEGVWIYSGVSNFKRIYNSNVLVKTIFDNADYKKVIEFGITHDIYYRYFQGVLKLKTINDKRHHEPYYFASNKFTPGANNYINSNAVFVRARMEIKKLAYDIATETYY